MSIGYGEYFRSFAANLKEYLRKDSLYLICGNKDDLIAMLLFLCKNNILPRTEENYYIFRVKGNQFFERVKDLNLEDCAFEGTRESELHFKIFVPLSIDFVELFFEKSLLFDSFSNNETFFKVFQKRLPIQLVSKLNDTQKNALLAGIFDGDGSAGIMITCPNCEKRNTIRSNKFNCEKCNFDLTDIVRSMDYNIMLDSAHFERSEEELEFIVKIMKLKGHLYALFVQKEEPDKLSEEDFEKRLKKMDSRMKNYESLANRFHIPIVINKHILKKGLPSYNYAPDVYGSIKFLFTPHFRSNKEKLNWFGVTDIHKNNLKVIKNSVEYMFINKKRDVLNRVIFNRG
ncbi:MAG: hypothetical protein WAW23_06645, partial [Candidatus Methanoperedens sp.]